MPYVNIRVTEGGATKEQKAQLVQEITDVLKRVLNKNPEVTHVVIDEVSADNWGFGGKLVSDIRAEKAKQTSG